METRTRRFYLALAETVIKYFSCSVSIKKLYCPEITLGYGTIKFAIHNEAENVDQQFFPNNLKLFVEKFALKSGNSFNHGEQHKQP